MFRKSDPKLCSPGRQERFSVRSPLPERPGYRQLQRGVAILVLHIEVCIRAVEQKFENSRLLQLRDPSGLLQETSAVFFILPEDTAGHLKNPRPHPTVTELWRELSYYHVQSYKFQDLQLSVL